MKLLLSLFLLISLSVSAQYTTEILRVKLSPNFTTNVLIAKPTSYRTTRTYPIVYVGKGLGEDFASVQSNGIFGLLKKGFIPDTTQFIFVHIDQGSTTWIDYIPYTTDQLITVNKIPIDIDNSFIVGHSAGGGYAMSAEYGRNGGSKDPTIIGKRFRAIVAQAPNHDMNENNWAVADMLQIPAWVTVGANDQLAYINRAKSIQQNVPNYTELLIRSGVGHSGWDAIYNGSIKMGNGKTMWQFFTSNLLNKPTDNTPYIVQEVVLKMGLGMLQVFSDSTYQIIK